MPSSNAVQLLAVEPDLGRYLTAEERVEAERLMLPVRDIAPGRLDVNQLLDRLTADAGTDKLPTADIDRALRHVRAAKAHIGDWPEGAC